MSRNEALPLSSLGSLWLLGGLALVMAPHLLRFPSWIAVLCLLIMAWRLARDLRGWPLPGTVFRLALTLGGIAVVFATFGTIVGQEAGVALLAVMLSLKLAEMVTLRDAAVVVLLAYFLVASGFLFDVSLFSGLYLFGAVAILTAALIVLHHPAARPGLTRYYLRRSAVLLLQALPLMAVLFVLFPRVQGSLWNIAVTTPSARMGLSDNLNLGDVSNLASSGEIAFRVEFQGMPPPNRVRYWRGPVLWHTDGRRWTMLTPSEMRKAGPPHPLTTLGPPVDYTLSLTPESTGRWLPALDLPFIVPDKAILTTDLQIISLARGIESQKGQRFRMRSYPEARWQGLSPGLRAEALALPPGVNPQAVALGQEWMSQPPRQRVEMALRYLREGPYRYTRHPPLLGENPVDQFLFQSRQGFCEHYAAAFTFLMRAAGVPARVVTGYQGGEFNDLGNYWAVRQSDAHAWSEVYLDDQGWVRVDPTAVIPPARIDPDAIAGTDQMREAGKKEPLAQAAWRVAAQGWDALNFQWNRWVADYSVERQRDLLGRFGLLGWGNAALLALLAVAAAMAIAVALHFGHRPRRDADPALRLYRKFCRRLDRAGYSRGRNEGELAFARRVGQERPDFALPVEAITALYQQSRYGRGGAMLLPQLRAAVATFRP